MLSITLIVIKTVYHNLKKHINFNTRETNLAGSEENFSFSALVLGVVADQPLQHAGASVLLLPHPRLARLHQHPVPVV